MAESGDRDDAGSAPERTVGVEAPAPAAKAPVATVYDEVRKLLSDCGWVQGRETSGRRLSLTAAIDAVVAADARRPVGSPAGPALARGGRVRRHLCELAGAANLVAWNDDGGRHVDDVVELLRFAAVAYPDD